MGFPDSLAPSGSLSDMHAFPCDPLRLLLTGLVYFCLCIFHICALFHVAEWEAVLPGEAELSFPTSALGFGTPTFSVLTSTSLGSNNVGSLRFHFSKLHSSSLATRLKGEISERHHPDLRRDLPDGTCPRPLQLF